MSTTIHNPSSITHTGLLRTYLAPEWRRTVLLLALLLISSGLALLNPGVLARFIDVVLAGEQGALGLGALFLALALVNQGLTILTNYLSTDIGLQATNRVRTDVTLHCLGLDLSFHNRTTAGAFIERIDGDVSKLNAFLSSFAVLLLQNGLLLIGALTAITLIDWRAGASIGVVVVITMLLLEAARRGAIPPMQRERAASADVFSVVEERLAGIEDLRANGASAYALRGFFEQSRRWGWAHIRAHTIGSLVYQTANICYVIGVVLTLSLAVWLVGSSAITIGAAYAMYRYVELLRRPIQQIGRQIQDVQQAGAAILRLDELFAQQSAISDTGTTPLPETPLAVGFHNVQFRYPPSDITQPSRLAIDNLSFRLPAGRVLGILGRTGSGKTTITRLLLRFYGAEQGAVTLNDVPIDAVPLAALRSRIGLVTQEVQIFNASVRDNLSLFDPAIADQQLLAALAAVELRVWFETLPDGLDTVLPSGGGISAGQAQLFAVARVLLRNPGLVILDEASSRLDPVTEQRLEHALQRLLAGRTAIIIAHRLATVERADDILIMEDGRCVEYGPRQELAADANSRFGQLLQVGMDDVLA